jgi:hypothetical protein
MLFFNFVTFARWTHPLAPYRSRIFNLIQPHPTPSNLIHSCIQLPMAPKYTCQCSSCSGSSNSVTQRTLEAHLEKDERHLQSLTSSDTSFGSFLRSCIYQTKKLLVDIHGGSALLGSEGTFAASYPDVIHGEFFCFVDLSAYAYHWMCLINQTMLINLVSYASV